MTENSVYHTIQSIIPNLHALKYEKNRHRINLIYVSALLECHHQGVLYQLIVSFELVRNVSHSMCTSLIGMFHPFIGHEGL